MAWLKANGFHYIVVQRGKADFTADDTDSMHVIRDTDQYKLEVKRRDLDGEALLLCRSSGRVEKDQGGSAAARSACLSSGCSAITTVWAKRATPSFYLKVVEMIGRLRQKYPRASKLYDVQVLADEAREARVLAKVIVWTKSDSAYDSQRRFEGCYVLRTDRTELGDAQIWQTYVMLTRVKSVFRSLKSSLGLRPNFHQNRARFEKVGR